MKKLWLFNAGGNLEQVRHEVVRGGEYAIADVSTFEDGEYGSQLVPDRATLSQVRQAGGYCFIVGNERMLNQARLAAYMAIKAGGGKVIALQSIGSSVAEGVRFRENVWIDRGARILSGANIGANTWVMQNSEIGTNCKVGSSCWIGPNCQISEGATLGKNCTLGRGSVIGPDVVLPDWSSIGNNVVLTKSPKNILFIDPRFRAPVHIFNE
jgi:acetyltransferase-like isoleucine patch superfamily enzyme